MLLNMPSANLGEAAQTLPREKEYGFKKYKDIDTVLFSKGSWRGTVTSYYVGYKDIINGHPSGGALSCLYHARLGMLSAASMTEYRRWEKNNMIDKEKVEHFMCLTPRLELVIDGEVEYRNINDFKSGLITEETADEL